MFRSERREFLSREIRENEKRIALTLFIEISVSRWIERCRELSRFKMARRSYRVAIKELSKGVHSNVTLMVREAIENLSSIQELPRWIENLLRSYRARFSEILMDQNCDNNYRERKLKRLDR